MGIAAYYRGNAVISRQTQRDLGIPEPCYKPEARPPGWGGKAAARALERARRLLSSAERHGLRPLDEESLVELVAEKARVGKKTAAAAVRQALEERA